MTRRRWIADRRESSTASLEGEQAAHLARVLRAQPGMEFDVAAEGRVWRGRISEISEDLVRFTLLEEIQTDKALPITLLISIFKFDRMEWLIEKATELGVERVCPVIASRSEKHLAQAAQARVERWRRIAREAAKQSRRSGLPLIEQPASLQSAAGAEAGRSRLRLLLSECETETSLRAAVERALHREQDPQKDVKTELERTDEARYQNTAGEQRSEFAAALAIGPEGGWTPRESDLLIAEGWQPVSLGPRILRAETAGIAAIAILAACLEER